MGSQVSECSLHKEIPKTCAKFPGVGFECKTLGRTLPPNPILSFGDKTPCNYKSTLLESTPEGIARPKTLPALCWFFAFYVEQTDGGLAKS